MSVQSIATPIRRAALLAAQVTRYPTGLVSCLGAIIAFSLTLPATRAAVPELGAFFVAAARSVVGGLLALIVMGVRRERFPRRYFWRLLLVAFGVVFGFPFATAYGMTFVPASHGTIVTALVPIATALYAAFRNAERPAPAFWLAAGLGVATVVGFGYLQSGFALNPGDLWLLGSVCFAAVGYTEGALLAQHIGGMRVISWALIVSIVPGVPLVAYAWPTGSLLTLSTGATLGLSYVCIVSMYLGMIAWYHGLSRGSVAQASQLQLLQPVLGLGWSWWLLGEQLAASTLPAALVVVGCVVWSRRARVTLQRRDQAPARVAQRRLSSGELGPLTEPNSSLANEAKIGPLGRTRTALL